MQPANVAPARGLAFLVVLLLCASVLRAQIAFPCHTGKDRMGDGVNCTRMELPRGLCSACPLRPALPNGKFAKCWDIFDTAAPGCLPKMQEYAAANPCDGIRTKAVAEFAQDPSTGNARAVLDYFLYSVCEQCCDCVPMGANAQLFPQYLATHTAANPTLYTATRGNCPAHAVYDICTVAPKITHFAHPGDPPLPGAADLPPACPLLREWTRSPASAGWQENPMTTLVPAVEFFLLNTLEKTQCAQKDIWDRCYALESAQSNLGVPEALPEVTGDPTPSPEVSPSVADALSPNSSPLPACFPATASVERPGGQQTPMKDLQVDDLVRVASGAFSPVYRFSHTDAGTGATVERVAAPAGVAITLTSGHNLTVNGASSVTLGDTAVSVHGPVTVISITPILLPPAGSSVTGDVVCTTYSQAPPSDGLNLSAPIRALLFSGEATEASTGKLLKRGTRVSVHVARP